MDDKVIRLGAPTFGPEELEGVRAVLDSGWVAGQGPMNRELERAFAERVETKHAVAVSNCTAGMHLCLLAMGVGAGDEVLVADYTFPATGHAVLFVGAKPVFVDVTRDSWTIDPTCLEAALTPRTRGIIAVDAFGQCADYTALQAFADKHELFLLEDAAAAAGASFRGKPAGGFGNAACFSLHGRKGITCGEGGLVTSDDDALIAKVRKLACFGMESAFSRQSRHHLTVPTFTDLGYNYKLSDVHAAIAIAQLARLDELVAARRRVADRYATLLADIEGLQLPQVAPHREVTWQSYVVTVEPPLSRNDIARRLREANVQSNIGTYCSHVQPVYASEHSCPVSAELFGRHMAIPMHANLTEPEVERVAAVVRTAVAESRKSLG